MSENPRSRDYDRWNGGSSSSSDDNARPLPRSDSNADSSNGFYQFNGDSQGRANNSGVPYESDSSSEFGAYHPPKAPWEVNNSYDFSGRADTSGLNTSENANGAQHTYGESSWEYTQESRNSDSYTSPAPGGTPSFVEKPQRSRSLAGVLGILFGTFGVHNFYLGKYAIGGVQLALTVLSGGSLTILVGVWGIVEGIMYLTNNNGKWNEDRWGRPLA